MASFYIQFLTTCIIFLGAIQEGLLVPSPKDNNNYEHLNQVYLYFKIIFYEMIYKWIMF